VAHQIWKRNALFTSMYFRLFNDSQKRGVKTYADISNIEGTI